MPRSIECDRVSIASSRRSSTDWVPERREVIRWSGTRASNDYAQGIIQDTVYEASVSTATQDWYAVLSC